MKNFYSISSHPGKQGEYFYNSFFKLHGIDACYTPIGCDVNNFEKTLYDLFSDADGISISMPFKQRVITHSKSKSLDVVIYNSCNTLVKTISGFDSYNTDLEGVIYTVSKITPEDKVIILGNGNMGKMYLKYMDILGYNNVKIQSKSLKNYDLRHSPCTVLINCTAVGTVNRDSPVDILHENTRLVIDLSINPNRLTELSKNVEYIGGQTFYKHQFIKQYAIYTGKVITGEDYDKIAAKR
jgi:shikimate 5-dehydrogenase